MAGRWWAVGHGQNSQENCGARHVLQLLGFERGKYNFAARLLETGKDLLRLAGTPLAFIAAEVGFIFSVVHPRLGIPILDTALKYGYEVEASRRSRPADQTG